MAIRYRSSKCFDFTDECGDEFAVEINDGVLQIAGHDGCDMPGVLAIGKDDARVISRLFAEYAGGEDFSSACDDDGDVPGDRLSAQADRIDELEYSVTAVKSRVEFWVANYAKILDRLDAIEPRLQPQSAPEPSRIPQQVADEMSAKFPVGTKLNGFSANNHTAFAGCEVLGPFFVSPVDKQPWVAAKTAYSTFVILKNVEPA